MMRYTILLAAFALCSTSMSTGCSGSVDAQSAKVKTEAELAKVKADAELAKVKADAGLTKAEAELAKVKADAEIAEAKAVRAEAELAKAKAEADMVRATGIRSGKATNKGNEPLKRQRPRPADAKEFPIEGTWVGSYKLGTMTTTQEFNAKDDGTFQTIAKTQSGFGMFNSQSVLVRRGTFTYSDGVLTWSGNFVGGMFDGFPDNGVATVTWDDQDQFTVAGNGQSITYKRKK